MKITLDEAHQILDGAKAVIVNDDNGALIFPDLQKLTGRPNNIFLHLVWEDYKYKIHSPTFKEKNNPEVEMINGNSTMVLFDDDLNRIELLILVPHS